MPSKFYIACLSVDPSLPNGYCLMPSIQPTWSFVCSRLNFENSKFFWKGFWSTLDLSDAQLVYVGEEKNGIYVKPTKRFDQGCLDGSKLLVNSFIQILKRIFLSNHCCFYNKQIRDVCANMAVLFGTRTTKRKHLFSEPNGFPVAETLREIAPINPVVST